MYDGELYNKSNALQRRDAEYILDKYYPMFCNRSRPNDVILDVGSASGNVTVDILYPRLPIDIFSLTAVDVSENMVNYARRKYQQFSKISFRVLDIAALKMPDDFYQRFNQIYSFYCLHWVQDQRAALQNIYKMLANGGVFMAAFIASNPIFDIYERMSKNDKWAKYMTDVQDFISPYHHTLNPVIDVAHTLKSIGFVVHLCTLESMHFSFNDIKSLKSSVKAVNPFLIRIPERLHEAYFDDYLQECYVHGAINHLETLTIEEKKIPAKILLTFFTEPKVEPQFVRFFRISKS